MGSTLFGYLGFFTLYWKKKYSVGWSTFSTAIKLVWNSWKSMGSGSCCLHRLFKGICWLQLLVILSLQITKVVLVWCTGDARSSRINKSTNQQKCSCPKWFMIRITGFFVVSSSKSLESMDVATAQKSPVILFSINLSTQRSLVMTILRSYCTWTENGWKSVVLGNLNRFQP